VFGSWRICSYRKPARRSCIRDRQETPLVQGAATQGPRPARVTAALTTAHVVVTQIIRFRASTRITRSHDALRVLEIEDLPHHRQPGATPA
jgi:hypothetical protein